MAESVFPAADLTAWAAAVRAGQVAAAPAEGVYGYCADPFNAAALEEIYSLKQRSLNKGFIVLIENLQQLTLFCPPLPPACMEAIHTYWPNQPHPATTLVLPALPTLSPRLTGGLPTIALRLPAEAYMQAYLRAVGTPLTSTSLNLSGQPAATHASQIPQNIPALTLPEALSGTPSRIFNPVTGEWLR